MESTIYDVFMRPMKLQRVEMNWNGRKMTVKNDAWQERDAGRAGFL